MTFHNDLDLGEHVLVGGRDEEPRAIPAHTLIVSRGQLQALNTAFDGALADPISESSEDVGTIVHVLDALVHLTKQRLVSSRALLAFPNILLLRHTSPLGSSRTGSSLGA
jgi:hypothetical protein